MDNKGKSKDHSKVLIIILNWNGWRDTIECLESLYQITYPNYDVIVVDNGSQDDSIEKIKEYCEGKIEVTSKFFEYDMSNKPIKIIEYTRERAEAGGGKEHEIADLHSNKKLILIKNEKNYGFAEGNNIGMRYALKTLNPDYILLLNNDTVVDRKFLDELVKVAESGEKIGIVGPKIYYYDYGGRNDVIQWGKTKFVRQLGMVWNPDRGEIDKFLEMHSKPVNFVYGACMLIKKHVFHNVGMFDGNFFLYWEETDLCVRVKNSGYYLVYTPNAKIWHKLSNQNGRKIVYRRISPDAIYYFARNIYLFAKKNLSISELCIFLLFFHLIRAPFLITTYLFYYHNKKAVKMFLRGMRDGAVLLLNRRI